MQLRLRPQYHFPVTLGFNEVSDILIPEKDHSGRETDFFKPSFASRGSRKVWDLFVAKLHQYKALAGAGGGQRPAAAAAAAAVGAIGGDVGPGVGSGEQVAVAGGVTGVEGGGVAAAGGVGGVHEPAASA